MSGRKGSWKWKLCLAIVAALIGLMVLAFSSFGQNWARDQVLDGYNQTPEAERRDSAWADRWLALAWWRSTILLDSEGGMEMYREFCGLPKDRRAPNNVFRDWKLESPLCSPDGDKGWGPEHPRAPEAFYNYLVLYDTLESSQFTHAECENYFRLFYTWMLYKTRKVHPNFSKYWPKIVILATRRSYPWANDIDPRAPLAPQAPAE
jgi:hypothetical protein